MDLKDTIKSLQHFNWKEACSGPDGKSSAGKFVCFWYGVACIGLTILSGLLYLIKWVDKAEIQNIFLFVGTQMPIVLGYLLTNKNLENKKSVIDASSPPPQ